jgi:hypothetical protein
MEFASLYLGNNSSFRATDETPARSMACSGAGSESVTRLTKMTCRRHQFGGVNG